MTKMNPETINIAIVGGGIGGFAAATALQHRGIVADVYEQAPALGEVGAGIIIHPPTQRLFKEWGLDEEFYSKASLNNTVQIHTAQGEFVTNATDSHSSPGSDKDGMVPASIRRTDLLNLVAGPVDPSRIHLDHKLTSIVETPDYVELTFENGAVVHADVVIGANGINSIIRKLFSADEPIYSGLHSVRTILDREITKDTAKDDATVMYNGEEVFLLMQPVAGGMHFDIAYPSDDPAWFTPVTKEELTAKMAGHSEKLIKLLDAIEYPILARALYHRRPIERWSTKRITLLGDAAHSMLPTLGQGANTAIAGADAIARAFSECSTVEEALQQYENERRPITTAIQNESAGLKEAFKVG